MTDRDPYAWIITHDQRTLYYRDPGEDVTGTYGPPDADHEHQMMALTIGAPFRVFDQIAGRVLLLGTYWTLRRGNEPAELAGVLDIPGLPKLPVADVVVQIIPEDVDAWFTIATKGTPS